jgi:hypothetical protein
MRPGAPRGCMRSTGHRPGRTVVRRAAGSKRRVGARTHRPSPAQSRDYRRARPFSDRRQAFCGKGSSRGPRRPPPRPWPATHRKSADRSRRAEAPPCLCPTFSRLALARNMPRKADMVGRFEPTGDDDTNRAEASRGPFSVETGRESPVLSHYPVGVLVTGRRLVSS